MAAHRQRRPPALEAVVHASHQAGHFDGVVLVALNGKMLCGLGEGLADREKKSPNTLDTPLPICSITKQFTALLVMQLVQAGKVRLMSVVTDYLPDFRADAGGKISVKDLLTQTSGLPSPDDALPGTDGVPGFYTQTDPKFVNAGYVVKTYLQGDLKMTPGEKFNYNNGDSLVWQAILEMVTGKSHARLLQEGVLGPLGMTHSGLIRQDAYAPGRAVGYVQEGGKLVREPYFHLATFGATGAIYSTARDMLRWNDALDRDTLLSKPYRQIMFTAEKSLGDVGLGS